MWIWPSSYLFGGCGKHEETYDPFQVQLNMAQGGEFSQFGKGTLDSIRSSVRGLAHYLVCNKFKECRKGNGGMGTQQEAKGWSGSQRNWTNSLFYLWLKRGGICSLSIPIPQPLPKLSIPIPQPPPQSTLRHPRKPLATIAKHYHSPTPDHIVANIGLIQLYPQTWESLGSSNP